MTKTPEEKATVRKNRTVQTNSEKTNLTAEEKAREYAIESPYYGLFEFFHQEHNLGLLDGQIQDIIYAVQEYLEKQSTEMEFVSSQNITDLYRASLIVIEKQKTELVAYREALKEIVDVSEIKVTNTQTLVERMNRQKTALAKAKQLIEEGE